MAVIDLGVVTEAPEAVDGTRRGWRWYAVFGALAAVLVAGNAEPVRGPLAEATVPVVGRYAFTGPDAVYLVEDQTIRRYGLPGGKLAWQLTWPADGLAQGVSRVGGTLLLTGDGLESQTVALDGATGETRWRRPGTPLHGTDDGLVLLTHSRPGDPTVRYEAVDATTGAVRWVLTDPDGSSSLLGDDRLVLWSPPDQVEVRDVRSGEVVSTAAVPGLGEDAMRPDGGSGIWVVGRLMLVARERGGRAVTEAYDLDRLVRRWTADLDLSSVYPSDCGDVLCLGAGGGSRVMEADTGRIRWSDSGSGALWRTGSVIVSYGFSEHPPRVRILDLEDGHLRADLGRWDIGPVDDNGITLAVRPGVGVGSWIAELDLIRGKVRILGVTRDAFACQPVGTAVVCTRPGENTGIWYRRPHR